MRNFRSPHVLYRGDIYAKPDIAIFTFVRLMDAEAYLNKLLVSPVMREGILKHYQMLLRLMKNRECEVFPQISFDFNLIEVEDGKCFKINERKFVETPSGEEQKGKISPRMFMSYDPNKNPDAGHFKDGILNSFPDLTVRIKFLNKFYQCLLAHRMEQKVRKLVVHGPKDSGKSSWVNVLMGVIPMERIATITEERQFSASMITEDTELTIVDEWSESTLRGDQAKTILQGGLTAIPRKHTSAKLVENKSPFYITTNILPNFGAEDENVQRRIYCFETVSLSMPILGAGKWMRENSMECIAWMANELNNNSNLIEEEERWYESLPSEQDQRPDFANGKKESLFDINQVKNLTEKDISLSYLHPGDIDKSCKEPEKFLHESFGGKAKELCELKLDEMKKNAEELAVLGSYDDIMSSDNENEQLCPFNRKSFQRKVYLALKCNFNKPNLTPIDASRMLLYKGPPKTPDHFAWRLVQGKIDNNFDHKGFLREYQQIIPKIYELRDRTGIRIVEWSNHNPEDPVRKMDMQLQSEVKKTQAEAQENDKKSERPPKRKFTIQRRRPLSDLQRQKKESTDVKSSNVEIEVESEDNEIFINSKTTRTR